MSLEFFQSGEILRHNFKDSPNSSGICACLGGKITLFFLENRFAYLKYLDNFVYLISYNFLRIYLYLYFSLLSRSKYIILFYFLIYKYMDFFILYKFDNILKIKFK